ncbi:hypothetical protein PSTT_00433 [Puccinia striiformis]|uniref:Wax synthase domain-containing protein n=1 Tax=Puccinia striiformis TaxID=27350 RepID=A0A2S4W7E5_9BASI|nr:hypothetical protein PSTT_00433 [Puccinia striiformis]
MCILPPSTHIRGRNPQSRRALLTKMQSINGTTTLSLKRLVSPWLGANGTSPSWAPTSGEPAQGISSRFLSEKRFILSLMLIQCALLHPKFQNSTSARLTRLSLGPLIIGWWLCCPFRLPVLPAEDRNLISFFMATILALKSIEWTFATGPYHMRSLKTVQGAPVWEKESESEASSNNNKTNMEDLFLWTIMLFTSERGFRWSWGPEAKGNTRSFSGALFELVWLHVLMVPCLGFLLYSQDWTDYHFYPQRALLSMGVPSFRGLGLLAGCLHSVCTLFAIRCSFEIFHGTATLMTYLLPDGQSESSTQQASHLTSAPLFELSSLAHFWGKFWHQKYRRAFVFCGGKPAMWLARVLGGSSKVQKACGVVGVFTISGFLHEYPMYAFQQEPHPYPRKLFKTLPASFLFFFVQSFGVILEPLIIPYIPKQIGGPKIWTVSFLLLTAPLFTGEVMSPGRSDESIPTSSTMDLG